MVSGGVDWGWTWGSRRSLPSVTILRFHATFLPQPDAGRSTACSYRIALRAGSGQQPLDGNAGAELRDLTARCSLGGSGLCLGNGLPAPPDADVRVKAGRRLAFRCCPTSCEPRSFPTPSPRCPALVFLRLQLEPAQHRAGSQSPCRVESCRHQPCFSLTHRSQRAGVRVKTRVAINILGSGACSSWHCQDFLLSIFS